MKYKVDLEFTAVQRVTIEVEREALPPPVAHWDIEVTDEELDEARKQLGSFFEETDVDVTWVREAK